MTLVINDPLWMCDCNIAILGKLQRSILPATAPPRTDLISLADARFRLPPRLPSTILATTFAADNRLSGSLALHPNTATPPPVLLCPTCPECPATSFLDPFGNCILASPYPDCPALTPNTTTICSAIGGPGTSCSFTNPFMSSPANTDVFYYQGFFYEIDFSSQSTCTTDSNFVCWNYLRSLPCNSS